MTQQPLLVELFTEELPPKALSTIGDVFAQKIAEGLRKRAMVAEGARTDAFATPRRLAVRVDGVLEKSPDQPRREKVLPVSVAFDAQGNPTQALQKKLAAMNASHVDPASLDPKDLVRRATGLDFPFEVLTSDPWVCHRLLAERYRAGRVFLAGDACHLHPPFGGFGMSGVGSKAGGADYLLQFVEPRASCENTMRRGFAPEL